MKPIEIFPTLAALLLASSVAAQDTAAPADQDQGQADTEAAASEAPQDPAQNFVTEAFGDWEVRCSADKTNCFMYVLARDTSLSPVAEISIVALPQGGDATAGVTVVTPLGTLLTEGLVLQIDSGRARQYDFGWCTRAGCFSRFGFTADELASMKQGANAKMRIVSVSAPDQPVLLDISLSGFTAGFNALPVRQN